ncbi:MAG: RNA polymerase-binding protein DksA [Proteobacteria bacterium]|nr:RNA polymerase-binding protein DksA [Pseudomonadota bacterium]
MAVSKAKNTKAKTKTPTKAPAKPAAKNPSKTQAQAKAPVKAAAKTPAKGAKKPANDIGISARFKPVTKLPEGYKPNDKEEYMNDKHLEYFRRKLVDWREELLKESNETLDHLKEENWNEPDITDRATVETDAALELRTRDRYRKLINKIDAALRRIYTGEYGFCEESGDEIGLKRLEARPIATLSIAAQERHERDEKQYSDD